MKLTKLQQEFFDLLCDDVDVVSVFETEEEILAWQEALVADIRTMNAAELRHNLKVWKECK